MTMGKYHPLDDSYSEIRIIPATGGVHVVATMNGAQCVEVPRSSATAWRRPGSPTSGSATSSWTSTSTHS